MAGGFHSIGLLASAIAHGALFTLALFWGDLFRAPETDPIQIVETSVISEAEFAALTGQDGAAARPAPTPPEPTPEPVAEPAPTPVVPAEPEIPPDPTPVVETPEEDSDAPYDRAPPPPSELALNADATRDRSPDRQIREALPPVRPAPEPAALAEAEPETAPEVEAASEPEPEPAPDPSPRPEIAEAPRQPEAPDPDATPEPDAPDIPPQPATAEAAPEPDPEPEPTPPAEPVVAEEAPAQAPTPRLRPRPPQQVAAAEPAQDPAPRDQGDLFDNISRSLSGLDETAPTPPRAQTQQARPASRPLSAGEKAAFAFNFKRFWSPPTPGPDLAELVVTLEISVGRDGLLLSEPTPVAPSGALTTRQATAIFNAMRAVRQGAPYLGPAEKYDRWRRIRVTYDPITVEATVN